MCIPKESGQKFLASHKLSRVNTKTILGKDLATSLNYGQGHGCLLYSHKLYDYVKHNDSRIIYAQLQNQMAHNYTAECKSSFYFVSFTSDNMN